MPVPPRTPPELEGGPTHGLADAGSVVLLFEGQSTRQGIHYVDQHLPGSTRAGSAWAAVPRWDRSGTPEPDGNPGWDPNDVRPRPVPLDVVGALHG